MHTYIVVDSDDNWLWFGEEATPEKALEAAMETSSYNPLNNTYVYRVVEEHWFVGGEKIETRMFDRV